MTTDELEIFAFNNGKTGLFSVDDDCLCDGTTIIPFGPKQPSFFDAIGDDTINDVIETQNSNQVTTTSTLTNIPEGQSLTSMLTADSKSVEEKSTGKSLLFWALVAGGVGLVYKATRGPKKVNV